MLPQQYCLRWKYHHSNLQTMFSQLLDRGCFCDVTLACEGQLIRAHRVVLCACSTFFDTILTNYASDRDPIIIMKDVTFADIKCLIEFMYKGEINVEHANLASLLKTADDLKIKGLAEVTWRDEDDIPPPPPTPHTEFHSPSTQRAHTNAYDYTTTGHHHHNNNNHHHHHYETQQRSQTPELETTEQKTSTSPKHNNSEVACQRMPTLTPIPNTGVSIVAAGNSPVDTYMGPKRKRGRPPLDDAYDVFNVRKLSQQYADNSDTQPAFAENSQYTDDHPIAVSHNSRGSSPITAAAVAYQQHIQKQRLRQKSLRSQDDHIDDADNESEWINSNLDVSENEHKVTVDHDIDQDEEEEVAQDLKITPDIKEEEAKRKEESSRIKEKTPERQKSKAVKRKNSKEDNNTFTLDKIELRKKYEQLERAEREETSTVQPVPQTVEDMETSQNKTDKNAITNGENAKHSSNKNSANASTPTSSSSSSSPPSSSSAAPQKSSGHNHSRQASPSATTTSSLHHTHHYGKYVPDGYLINEHGILMTHDFVHAPTAAIPTSSATTASNGHHIEDYADIKMEEFNETELRLTSEEMSQWQDVIKMDDYLAKGRRPQFWEEPFTRRKAARILGVSYGTLYGRYRETYGCLKHPYNSSSVRNSQVALAVPPRFDIVWPSAKPGQIDIGKLRPKDLSELWTRPQI
uniref:BTB domain-containing protein n=1 Tax=Glossina brevipalpis TaxID=37001 RepID=A0A1A9WVD4_9MUSC